MEKGRPGQMDDRTNLGRAKCITGQMLDWKNVGLAKRWTGQT